jgi:hypothetical protein
MMRPGRQRKGLSPGTALAHSPSEDDANSARMVAELPCTLLCLITQKAVRIW